jgi:hypothetical protein
VKQELDRDVFSTGEVIIITSHIYNETLKPISLISVKLLQHLKAQADSKFFETLNEIYSDILSGVDPQTKDTRTIKITIPSKLQPSTNGELIQTRYFLQIQLDLGNGSFLECNIPLLFIFPMKEQSLVPGFFSRSNSSATDRDRVDSVHETTSLIHKSRDSNPNEGCCCIIN